VTIHTFYRLSVWVPLLAPAVVAAIVHGLDWRTEAWAVQKLVQLLLVSLLYGGIPYALLAIWATWWVGGRTEPDITRLMFLAPFLMAAIYLPVSVVAGMAVAAPIEPFLAVGVLGAIVSIPLGFAYVGFVLLLRQALGARVA
jgi:hypothetical protein